VVEPYDTLGRPDLADQQGTVLSGKCVETKRRDQMKPSTKDQIQGDLHQLKGKIKEKAGQVTSNPSLEHEGQNEKLARKVQKKIGQIEDVIEK